MLFGSDKRKDRKYSKLSKKDDALVKKLDALNWDDSRKSNRLYKKHNKTLQKLEEEPNVASAEKRAWLVSSQ